MKDEERQLKMGMIIALLENTTMSKEDIAAQVGVCRRTLVNWEQNYPDFVQKVKEARQSLTIIAEKNLRKGLIAEGENIENTFAGKMMNDLKTTRWYLERKGEGYQQQEQQTAVIGAIPLTEEQLEALKTKKTI